MLEKILDGMLGADRLDEVFREYMRIERNAEEGEDGYFPYVEVKSLDDIDFHNMKHVEKDDNHYSAIAVDGQNRKIYILESAYQKEPFIVMTSVFQEMFPMYNDQIPLMVQTDRMLDTFAAMKSVIYGGELWKTFFMLYCTIGIMKTYFSEYDQIKGYERNPYHPDVDEANMEEMLRQLPDKIENGDESSLQFMLYCFSDVLVYGHPVSFFSCGGRGELIQNLFDIFHKSLNEKFNMFLLYRIGKAYMRLLGGKQTEKKEKPEKQRPKKKNMPKKRKR